MVRTTSMRMSNETPEFTADLHTAIKHARRSLEISDELEDAALAAPPVNLMGRAYWQLGDFARSARMMERSVEQMRAVANGSEEATAAGFLSALLGYMGEFEKALSFSDLSIELAQKIKNPYAKAAAFHDRGIIHDQQGRWELALEQYSKAKKVAEQAGDMFRVYIVDFMEGRASLMTGKLARGIQLIEERIALSGKDRYTFSARSGQDGACLLPAGGRSIGRSTLP